MKLAAIDIGSNSVHMIIVKVTSRYSFEVLEREKKMVKLGAGVFANNKLTEKAYKAGLETITRYVQLADQHGVDEIITAATSAVREARNGGQFLDDLVDKTGLSPQVISGKEEARMIFLAVRNAIALQDESAMVLDIGGGSTEAVVGNKEEVLFGDSMKLGVQRLLDMFEDQGPVGKEAKGVLQAHINYLARSTIEKGMQHNPGRVIGTSGTIRTLGEAAHIAAGGKSFKSVNAEIVSREDIADLTGTLMETPMEKRSDIKGISKKRADAIHLGGVLLVQLLELADAGEITLCDASLREGLILDYIDRYSEKAARLPEFTDLRHRSVGQLALKFNSDLEQKSHVARLALELFDQLKEIQELGDYERDILEYAALLHGIGQYISFRRYHKNSRYIIKHSRLRGFNNEEILLIGHVARYHRKARPKKQHKKFKRLSKSQRNAVSILAGILRIAVALDKTKNQQVEHVQVDVSDKKLTITVTGEDKPELELWAAERSKKPLEKALDRKIRIEGLQNLEEVS